MNYFKDNGTKIFQYKISELCDEYGFDFNLSYNNSMNLSITPRLTINKITTNITIKTDNN
jgi:hypothetical protein